MLWTNASGTPVTMKPQSVQIELPSEAASDASANPLTVNWFAVVPAVYNLFVALKSGDAAKIMAAFQALIVALMGG